MHYNQGLIDRLESRNFLLEKLLQEVIDSDSSDLEEDLLDRINLALDGNDEDLFEDIDDE